MQGETRLRPATRIWLASCAILAIAACDRRVVPGDFCENYRPVYLQEEEAVYLVRVNRPEAEKIAAMNQLYEEVCVDGAIR